MLLRWVIIVHGLSAATILFLSFSFGLHFLIAAVVMFVICFGCFRCYQKCQCLIWSKISFDGHQWSLFPASSTVGDKPVLVELDYYYRFGKSWILGFRQLDKQRKRVIIPLLPDGCGSDSCDKDSLRYINHLLLMANR